MKIEGTFVSARVGMGYFNISIFSEYERTHSGSDTNRKFINMTNKKVTISIED
jgi:hypothetical protein